MTTIDGWADTQNNDRISDRQSNDLDMDEHSYKANNIDLPSCCCSAIIQRRPASKPTDAMYPYVHTLS